MWRSFGSLGGFRERPAGRPHNVGLNETFGSFFSISSSVPLSIGCPVACPPRRPSPAPPAGASPAARCVSLRPSSARLPRPRPSGAGNGSFLRLRYPLIRGRAGAAGIIFTRAASRAISLAGRPAKFGKRPTAHSLRDSFATALLEAGYEIRTVQELLDHTNVETTMIYTDVLNTGGRGVRSPLDRP